MVCIQSVETRECFGWSDSLAFGKNGYVKIIVVQDVFTSPVCFLIFFLTTWHNLIILKILTSPKLFKITLKKTVVLQRKRYMSLFSLQLRQKSDDLIKTYESEESTSCLYKSFMASICFWCSITFIKIQVMFLVDLKSEIIVYIVTFLRINIFLQKLQIVSLYP